VFGEDDISGAVALRSSVEWREMVPQLEISVGLFPGQGGYRSGVLDILNASGEAADAIATIDEISSEMLGRPLVRTLSGYVSSRDEELFAAEPELVQLGVFATSVATFEIFRSRGARVSLLVGHSLGEIAALVCSGALSAGDGARILCHRLMVLREHDASGGGMLALTCDRERAQRVLDLLPSAGAVVAVENGALQTVVSGPADALRRVAGIADAIGLPSTALRAPHPFHNDVLRPARRALAERIRGHRARTPDIPVYSPILERYYRPQEDLGELLASHLTTPVRFGPAIERAHADGARIWVEFGAGRALTNLVRSARPDAVVLTPLHGSQTALADAVAFVGASAATSPVAPVRVAPVPAASAPVAAPVATPAPAPPPATPPATPAPSPAVPAARTPLPAGEIEARIRALYANALEYPEEVFEPDAELEADLGVDSVKQTELMARLGEEFALGPRPEGMRMSDYRTFGKVVSFVSDSLATANGSRS
jgi:acyl transferase domain-containing protein